MPPRGTRASRTTPDTTSSTPASLLAARITTNPETPPSANTRAAAAQTRNARQLSQLHTRSDSDSGTTTTTTTPPRPKRDSDPPLLDVFFPRLHRQQTPRDRWMMHAIPPVVIGVLAAGLLSWRYGMWVPLAGWGWIMMHLGWMYFAALVVVEYGYLGWWRGLDG